MPGLLTPNPLKFIRQFADAPYVDMVFATTADRLTYLTSPRRYPGMVASDLELDSTVFVLNAAGNTWNPISGNGGGTGSLYTVNNGLTANTSSNFQLGGTLIHSTTIDGNIYGLNFSSIASTTLTVVNTSTGVAIAATSINNNAITGTSNIIGVYGFAGSTGIGVRGSSTDGMGIWATSVNNIGLYVSSQNSLAGQFITQPSSINTIVPILELKRQSSLISQGGAGLSIDFHSPIAASFSSKLSNRIVSKTINPDDPSYSSQLEIWGSNTNVFEQQLAITYAGQLVLNKYGSGSFSTQHIYLLGVDALGNIVETAVINQPNVYTVDNGLSESPAGNFELGGNLTKNTNITGGLFNLTISSANNSTIVAVNNSVGGQGIFSTGTTGITGIGITYGIRGTSVNNTGLSGFSNNGLGLQAQSINGLAAKFDISSTSNTIKPIIEIVRDSNGTGVAAGIGASIDFKIATDPGFNSPISNQLASRWTVADDNTRYSEFIITGVSSSVTQDLITFSANGSVKLNRYGSGSFVATASYNLAIDAEGNILEIPVTELTASFISSSNVYGPLGSNSVLSSVTASYAFLASESLDRPFLKNITSTSSLNVIKIHDAIFNPDDLVVLSGSIFIVSQYASYYVLGNLINSGSIILSGSLKIGGYLINIGDISGPGILS